MRLYCDRECSDKFFLSVAFHLHRQAKYATLQHLEPCEVAHGLHTNTLKCHFSNYNAGCMETKGRNNAC